MFGKKILRLPDNSFRIGGVSPDESQDLRNVRHVGALIAVPGYFPDGLIISGIKEPCNLFPVLVSEKSACAEKYDCEKNNDGRAVFLFSFAGFALAVFLFPFVFRRRLLCHFLCFFKLFRRLVFRRGRSGLGRLRGFRFFRHFQGDRLRRQFGSRNFIGGFCETLVFRDGFRLRELLGRLWCGSRILGFQLQLRHLERSFLLGFPFRCRSKFLSLEIHVGVYDAQCAGLRSGNRVLPPAHKTQVIGKFRGVLIAESRVFRHHFHDNARKGFRNIRIDLVRRNQSAEKMLLGDFRGGCAFIRETAGDEMIKCGAETVNIAPAVHGSPRQVFGADILRRSHDLIVFAVVDFTCDFGKAEVRQFCPSA